MPKTPKIESPEQEPVSKGRSGYELLFLVFFGYHLSNNSNNFHLWSIYSVPGTLPTVAYLTISHEVAVSILTAK